MPTTPVGSGIVKLKYGAATGFDEPSTWPILSAQPAYQTQRSIAASTARAAAGWRRPSAAATSSTNWSRRPSISSATRYSTWPRFIAVLPAQPGNALRATRTASRRSLREARAAFARGEPSAAETRYERPDSDRGKSPPTNSLYVLRTAIRAGVAAVAAVCARRATARDVPFRPFEDADERRVAISGPPGGRTRGARACRPRARSRIACSRRTATSDRSD